MINSNLKILVIVSQKGGVGKTTLVTGLAVTSEGAERHTAMFDVDPRGQSRSGTTRAPWKASPLSRCRRSE